jgi:DNA-binding NarL/FixJ family response regulator
LRVLLVDDHPLFREALAVTVHQLRPTAQVEQFDTVEQVTAAMSEDCADALILLDLQLADAAGMLGLVDLRVRFPALRVVIVSGRDDPQTVANAAACGASGYIPKTAPPASLAAALSAVMSGKTWFPATAGSSRADRLSAIQMRILDGIKRGMMNKQIAYEVGLSEHSIKYHLTGIFRKLGCQTRSQLVAAVSEPSIEA